MFYRADRKNKMAALALDCLRHFRLLWNRWTEFNESWQETRSQRPLPSLCFSDRSENKMAALASDCLRHFRLLLWNRWIKFNENLTGSKILTSSTKFVFLRLIGKTRMPPWLLICWDFFYLVAYCTQVHDMWPFGPLVHNFTETVWEWEHFIDYPIEKSGNSNASNIAI